MAQDQAGVLKRRQQAQQRAFVEARALRQFDKAQGGVAQVKCGEYEQGPVYGNGAALRGMLVGFGELGSFTWHEGTGQERSKEDGGKEKGERRKEKCAERDRAIAFPHTVPRYRTVPALSIDPQ